MRLRFAVGLLIVWCLVGDRLPAQFTSEDSPAGGPVLGEAVKSQYKFGVIVQATGGACRDLYITCPMPADWPEQRTEIVSEETTPNVGSVSYRSVARGVKQMVVRIPFLAAGQEAKALVTVSIERHKLLSPEKTDDLHAPAKPERELAVYLAPSPQIESRHPKIVKLAKEITADAEGDWAKAEAMYDWVREHVKYENGKLKGALAALKDGTGDCEELSSLFIALCRASKIPARTVWVPDHCYPEFYLVDEAGHGNWFPCQAAGDRAFGGIPEIRPILQKGDNFRDEDRPREKLRYFSEFLKGTPVGGGKPPKHQFVRETVGI